MLPANLHLRNIVDSAFNLFSAFQHPVVESSVTNQDLLRARLQAACLSPTSSIAALPPSEMRRELDSTKHELARANADVAKLEERCKMLEKTLRETRDLLKARELELDRTRRDRDHERALATRRRSDVGPHYGNSMDPDDPREIIQTRHSSLDMRSTAAGVQLNASLQNGRPIPQTNGTNNHLDQSRLSDTTSSSFSYTEEERARIRSNEVYLTRTDSWSGAQVLQAVHDINSEILQFAASATEVCTFDRDSRPSSARAIQAMHDTSARIGPNLARILSSRDHAQDPLLVQLALQGCVALCIARTLSSFCIGFPHKSDAVLAQIYSHMHFAEPQPTSSKWRALTHQRIHAMYPTLADYAVSELSDTILRWSADIFLIAGCQSYETSSRDGLRARFGEQVRRISRSVSRLARVTREEIMSTCFDVIVADHAAPFDDISMVDAFGEYGPSRGAVLATSELGLRCTTRLGGTELENGGVSLQKRMLLQPKVVLESVLDVIDPR